MAIYHGWEAEILLDGGVIGEAQGITWEVNPNLEAVYELGSRQPAEFHQGNEEITGTIDKLHVNSALVERILGNFPTPITLVVRPKKGQSPVYTLNGVLFETVGLEIGAEDLVTESIDFKAKSMTIS
ncbi:phage tail tube protein [Dehalococcoidia bacterium]|nr:phage tail tube protein [Dehalococcoidia bacterium]